MNKKIFRWLIAPILGAAFIWCCVHFYLSRETYVPLTEQENPPPVAPAAVVPVEELFPHEITPKSTLSSSLRKLEVPSQVIHQIVEAAKPVGDLTKVKAGMRFQIVKTPDPNSEVVGFKFRFSAIEMLEIRKLNGTWVAEKIVEPTETRVVTFSGNVQVSLWESAEQAKMDPYLIAELAEIFAFEVDFAREVRANDEWHLSVEEKLVRGQHYAWGSILEAQFINAGEPHDAILFRMNGEKLGYFTPEGKSLRRMFLKSPIKFGRISSRFQKARFHPILKISRPHLGVDYAAPAGTPIRAVGSGVIKQAAWSGGGGKTIRIRHNSTYETAYKHLSRFADGIRPGANVQQGQTIGYVGNTGLSTAPHLHFEFYIAGRYVDPLSQKFPSADPVPPELMKQFQSEAAILRKSRTPAKAETAPQ